MPLGLSIASGAPYARWSPGVLKPGILILVVVCTAPTVNAGAVKAVCEEKVVTGVVFEITTSRNLKINWPVNSYLVTNTNSAANSLA